MQAAEVATSLLTLFAGVGIFLIACSMMSSHLEALGSKKLKALFAKTGKSKLVGVGVGTVTTAAIQSSSATTVMVIGFVNAGILTLTQAAAVIFGANVGTTVTGQLVALGLFGKNTVSTSVIFAAFAGVGAFIRTFAKKDKWQHAGGIAAGFGMLFAGLSMMSNAMAYFSEREQVRLFLATFENPFLLLAVGALLTALLQSSSVMTSMVIAMTVSGLITLEQGIYITMGSNVGTCITALLAGLTSTRNAKRTALIHLLFNVGGAAVFTAVGLCLRLGHTGYGELFSKLFPRAPQLQLAMFHTVFNVCTVLFVLPLTNPLVKLVCKIVPDKAPTANEQTPHCCYVEEHMLSTPPLAVQQTKNEILRMAEIANENCNLACDRICTLQNEHAEQFCANEQQLDYLRTTLHGFIARLLKADLGEKDRLFLTAAIRSVSDLERVGDYAENITEYADHLLQANAAFSPQAVEEVRRLQDAINRLFADALAAYRNDDTAALQRALQTEESIDALTEQLTQTHIRRLGEGECSPEVGAQYLSLSANLERIADHYVNVAKTIRGRAAA